MNANSITTIMTGSKGTEKKRKRRISASGTYADIAARFQCEKMRGFLVQVERSEADNALSDHSLSPHPLTTVQAEPQTHIVGAI